MANVQALGRKLDLNARSTVGAMRCGVRRPDLTQQRRILLRSPRWMMPLLVRPRDAPIVNDGFADTTTKINHDVLLRGLRILTRRTHAGDVAFPSACWIAYGNFAECIRVEPDRRPSSPRRNTNESTS